MLEYIPKGGKIMLFKMKLCYPIDMKKSLEDFNYYALHNGIFTNTNQVGILEDLIVQKSSRRGFVREILTGLLIPYVILESEKNDENDRKKYCYSVMGKQEYGYFAFGIKKRNTIISEIDEMFYMKEPTLEEVEAYRKKHPNKEEWTRHIEVLLQAGREEVKPILLEQRKKLQQQMKKSVLSVLSLQKKK